MIFAWLPHPPVTLGELFILFWPEKDTAFSIATPNWGNAPVIKRVASTDDATLRPLLHRNTDTSVPTGIG
ncbi:MAG: hypothetical protein ACSLEL_04640 [Candidatus Malihini olakiniferum]